MSRYVKAELCLLGEIADGVLCRMTGLNLPRLLRPLLRVLVRLATG